MVLGLLLAAFGSVAAQNWVSIGKFHPRPEILWYDDLVDRLYVAGTYTWFDSTEVHGFGYVQGDTIISLGCGFGWGGEPRCGITVPNTSLSDGVAGLIRFRGDLYATGTFDFAGGNLCNGIAKWGIDDWEPVGTGIQNYGYGNGLKVIGDYLYAYGAFNDINGVVAHGLARFDGQQWEAVNNLPILGSQSSYNDIKDIELYNEELYILGNFSKPGTSPPIRDIAKWNGFEWVAVEMGMNGSFGYLTRLDVFQGKLIIAGAYNPVQNPNSIPGYNIVSWDGQLWDTMMGGLRGFPGQNARVLDMQVHDGVLYVVGDFQFAGNLAANSIAKWDGIQWCGSPDLMDFGPNSIAFLHDTLYVAGSFHEINGDSSLAACAKWSDLSFGENCLGAAIQYTSEQANVISLHPNPTHSTLTLTLESTATTEIQIHDLQGRTILPAQKYQNGEEIDASALPAGLYFLEVQQRNMQPQVIKFVKE